MFYTAQLVPFDYEEDDEYHIGHIQVKFKKRIQWARPCMPFGEFKLPSNEWIEKYGADNKIQVYVTEVDNSDSLIWVGFKFAADALIHSASESYPYRRVTFTENWQTVVDDSESGGFYEVAHINGNKLRIDSDKDTKNNSIVITHVLKDDAINKIALTEDGIKLTDRFKNTVTLTDDSIEISKDGKSVVKLEDGKYSIKSDKTHLGSASADNPMLKGQDTTDLLRDVLSELSKIVTEIQTLCTAEAAAAATPPLTPMAAGFTAAGSQMAAHLPNITKFQTTLKTLLSTKNYLDS